MMAGQPDAGFASGIKIPGHAQSVSRPVEKIATLDTLRVPLSGC